MTNYPTAWQRRVLWTVFTYFAIVGAGAVAVMLLYYFGQAVGFLQPVLIPFAVAAVLAFLLEPIVRLINARTRLSRTWSVFVVLGTCVLLLVLLLVSVVPRMYESTANMVRDFPAYTAKAQQRITGLIDATEARLNKFQHLLPAPVASPTPGATPDALGSPTASAAPGASAAPAEAAPASPAPSPGQEASPSPGPASAGGEQAQAPAGQPTAAGSAGPMDLRTYISKQIPALQSKVPAVLDSVWHLLFKSLGAVGTLIDGIIIPVYLFFLLSESHNIARRWSEYLPIRDSPFKKEVVSVLLEVNGYVVAFFRGQLLVSTIDATLIGGALALFVHLDFSFFIGLLVLVLTFIPYLGIIICYVPAILIAIIQYGDFLHPMEVVAIMFIVQTLESTIISPKIVGDSVGLHPVTVILSVFGWSLLLNGPIGAILAVPLSATVKVLLRRYVWEPSGRGRHFLPVSGASAAMLEDEVRRADEAVAGKSDADGPRRAGAPVASAVQAQPDPTSHPMAQQDQDH